MLQTVSPSLTESEYLAAHINGGGSRFLKQSLVLPGRDPMRGAETMRSNRRYDPRRRELSRAGNVRLLGHCSREMLTASLSGFDPGCAKTLDFH
jgi:hypothetical protein